MDKISSLVTGYADLETDYAKLTSSFEPTSVPTTIKQNIATITSIILSLQSKQSSDLNVVTNSVVTSGSYSYLNAIIQAQASLNFYSILQNIATETNSASKASMMTEAARASQVMTEIFDEHAFLKGHYPSLGGNAALLGVYIVLIIVMALSSIFYHQWWFLSCWSCGLILEIVGFIGRIMLSQDLSSFTAYVMNSVALTLAPSFMMAGIYYIIAQIALIYGERFSVLNPMQYSLIFITSDVFSILIQGAGGGIAAGGAGGNGNVDLGNQLLVAGIAIQVGTIFIFQCFWYIQMFRIYKEYKAYGSSRFNSNFKHIRDRNLLVPFICGVSICCLLIFVRCIYRLIELKQGWDSKLSYEEIYFMIFEGLLISLNAAIICIFSPGVAYGRNSHLYIDKSLKKSFSVKKQKPEEESDLESLKTLDYVGQETQPRTTL